MHPFFNWVGSKRHYVGRLEKYCPTDFRPNQSTYFEPFLGSGSMLLHLQPSKAIISDIDCVVTQAFTSMIRESSHVRRALRACYAVEDRKSLYNELSMQFTRLSTAEKTAALIFISKHSYGSLMRYTNDGTRLYLNYRKEFSGMNWENFDRVAKYLRKNVIKVTCQPYPAVLSQAKEGDFCFLDPPYTMIQKSVSKEYYRNDMIVIEELADTMNKLHIKGCFVLLINSRDNRLIQLLKHYKVYKFEASEKLSNSKIRREYIYINYASDLD